MRISKFEFKNLVRNIRKYRIFDLADKIRSIFSLKSFGHKIKAIFFQIELNWDGVGDKVAILNFQLFAFANFLGIFNGNFH